MKFAVILLLSFCLISCKKETPLITPEPEEYYIKMTVDGEEYYFSQDDPDAGMNKFENKINNLFLVKSSDQGTIRISVWELQNDIKMMPLPLQLSQLSANNRTPPYFSLTYEAKGTASSWGGGGIKLVIQNNFNHIISGKLTGVVSKYVGPGYKEVEIKNAKFRIKYRVVNP